MVEGPDRDWKVELLTGGDFLDDPFDCACRTVPRDSGECGQLSVMGVGAPDAEESYLQLRAFESSWTLTAVRPAVVAVNEEEDVLSVALLDPDRMT